VVVVTVVVVVAAVVVAAQLFGQESPGSNQNPQLAQRINGDEVVVPVVVTVAVGVVGELPVVVVVTVGVVGELPVVVVVAGVEGVVTVVVVPTGPPPGIPDTVKFSRIVATAAPPTPNWVLLCPPWV